MRPLVTIVTLVAVLVSGCATTGEESSAADTSARDSSLLERHDLGGLSGAEVVDTLDRLPLDERPGDLMASVKPDQVVLTTEDDELALETPEGQFYLSVAPYVEQTHDCFHHSLTTCRGELGDADLDVTITDDSGQVLVDETVTTFDNGFAGFWLPSDIEGTLRIEHDGLAATADIATGAEDPTCLTTVQLA